MFGGILSGHRLAVYVLKSMMILLYVHQSGFMLRCSPRYLADLCVPAHSVHGRQQLRSTASGTLLVPRPRTATGQRSFAINGPRT